MNNQRHRVLVLGGGIAGMTAAWHLARNGIQVDIVEKDYFLGGHAIEYNCKAVQQCEQCEACSVEKMLKNVTAEPNINIHLAAEVQEIKKNNHLEVLVQKKPQFDTPEEQAALRKAYASNQVPGAVLRGYSKNNKPLYALKAEMLDQLKAKKDEVLPDAQLELDKVGIQEKIKVDALVLATGFQPFDPVKKPTYSYSIENNVVTALDMERAKKENGYYLRPSDKKFPGKVAFIQCVGSRNEQLGNLWCSHVCCPYALRMAQVMKAEHPDTEITVFYMDIQNIGRNSPLFYEKCLSELRFIRNIPVDIFPNLNNDGRLQVSYMQESGPETVREDFDLVVLSVGITPGRDNASLSEMLDMQRDVDGFFNAEYQAAEDGLQGNIFVAGTAAGPKNISESIAHAGEAVHGVLKYLGVYA